ncbi:anti-sigma factor family protein [Blastopirellula retiformator]|uniref:Putative zinc-finger domain-containing protein n=1 Tax=Blastopirellula retiformator TaxID=2527970 RepID=A0A5C5UV15_9BACT|nr:zf-HC2 domain-containing protein [Blastopirellula retiformator]TWT29487.1 hypothetical protein Enr8_50030 [Blastopirellula retiformator]
MLRRRRLAVQTVGSLCSVFLVIGLVLWLGPAQRLPVYATLTCSECRNQMHAYHSQALTVSQMRQMDAHFGHCPGCKRRYDDMVRQCDEKKECDKEKCDGVSGKCQADASCKVSRCRLWKCEAQTCKSTHSGRPDCSPRSEL